MSVPTTKKSWCWHFSTYIFCLEIPRYGWDLFLVFVGSYSNIYCSELESPLFYIAKCFFWIRVYIDIFTWHNIFLFFNHHPDPHIWVYKMDPRCCLYWQFPWYCVWAIFLTRNGQKLPSWIRDESVITSFCTAISPMVSYPFREKWEDGV